MPLMPPEIDHPQAKELESISHILDGKPIICEHVMQDLCKDRPTSTRKGARGMTAEQVLRAAIVKMLFGFETFAQPTKIHPTQYGPSKTDLSYCLNLIYYLFCAIFSS